jgi:hypothetical protein
MFFSRDAGLYSYCSVLLTENPAHDDVLSYDSDY